MLSLSRNVNNANRRVLCNYSNNEILNYRYVSTSGAGTAKTQIQSSWKKIWTRWVPIPTGVGITLLAILQWRNIRNKKLQEEEQKTIRDWEITCYRSVPLRPLSRAWGWISDRPVPQSLRPWVYGKYSSLYAVNLDEIEHDLISYVSLAEFFSRRLKTGVRPIDSSHCVVSPADGTILNLGEVTSCHIEQVKGVTYSILAFLGDISWKQSPQAQLQYSSIIEGYNPSANRNNNDKVKEKDNTFDYINNNSSSDKFNSNIDSIGYGVSEIKEKLVMDNLNTSQLSKTRLDNNTVSWNQYKRQLLKNPDENELYQLVVYLAPGDYHRFHSPTDWHVHYRRHFQGELLSVNPRIASWVPELFSLNERVIYYGEWEHGFFSMAAVGATNVGSIRVHHDETLHTNGRRWPHGIRYRDKAFDMVWQKGEEVGEFRMGSTIVVLFEAPRGSKFSTMPKQKIKVGESVTCVLDKCVTDRDND